MTRRRIALAVLLGFGLAGASAAQDEPLRPERALAWKPKEYEGSTLHPSIDFLVPKREWERMDVWVPNEPAAGLLPCVVAVFGGGYGDKMGGFMNDARPLLQRGFVVAAPDYGLMTDAPVPLCAWDVANAIRYLRAHAEAYRIDPERIGLWGWSAGGWIGQDLCYAGPDRMVHTPFKDARKKKVSRWFPMLEPRPQFPEQSVRVQAVVSDWGAGKLWDRHRKTPRAWLSPDDPPLFTCYNGAYAEDLVNPVMLLRRLGVPSRGVYGIEGNTHVPTFRTPAVHEDGRPTTWGDSILEFLEKQLKVVDTATAPEMRPHGGPLAGPTAVRLLSVHPKGSIHVTLDGSDPTPDSRTYTEPVEVSPGQTLKAISVREGLKPSRIATGVFVAGRASPRIRPPRREIRVRVGVPLEVKFEADHAEGASWFVGGMTGEKYREFGGQRFNPPKTVSWMSMDPATGVLRGTPRSKGKFPVIVSCMTPPEGRPPTPATGDAVLVVVTVDP